MAEGMESLFRRGAISKKQMGRMTDFNSKAGKRDQGGIRDRGLVKTGEINAPSHQKTGSPAKAGGLPSKGAQTRGNKAGPTVNAINERTGKKFPSGSKMSGGNKKRVGVKGGVEPSAPSQYGGPSNRKYG